MIENFAHVRVFSYHYPIKNKKYDFYLSILISESWAPFFLAAPCVNLISYYSHDYLSIFCTSQ